MGRLPSSNGHEEGVCLKRNDTTAIISLVILFSHPSIFSGALDLVEWIFMRLESFQQYPTPNTHHPACVSRNGRSRILENVKLDTF